MTQCQQVLSTKSRHVCCLVFDPLMSTIHMSQLFAQEQYAAQVTSTLTAAKAQRASLLTQVHSTSNFCVGPPEVVLNASRLVD
jgi:hypothetical protein